jgi:Deltex C-terminal domain
LPDNEDGRKLLKRLKNAWIQGLMFTIGTSWTMRQPKNCVTFASIHHRTSCSVALMASQIPDSRFFVNYNQELDSLGVSK